MQLAKNAAYSFLGMATPLVVSLASVPLFLAEIGAERYGSLAICWLLLGYFGQADLGFARATTQRISALGPKDVAQISRIIWSALLGTSITGLIGGALVFGGALIFFDRYFDAAPWLRQELLACVWLLALCNPIMALTGVLAGALMGAERFKLVAISNSISTTALQLFPLAIAYLVTDELAWLIAASLAGRVLGLMFVFAGVWSVFLRNGRFNPSFSEAKQLAQFGSWIMVSALVAPIMVSADRFLIGAMLGAAAVATYAIPFNLANRTLIVPGAIVQALFPRFASDSSADSLQRCRHYTVFIGQAFTPIVVVVVCLAQPLMALWLGNELDPRSVSVLQVLMVGIWFNSLAHVSSGFIQARGNPSFTALLHLAELPIVITLLFTLGTAYALVGYAMAFLARCLIDWSILANRARILDKQTLGRIAAMLAFVLLGLVAGSVVNSLPYLLLAASLIAGGAMVTALIQMPQSIKVRLSAIPVFRSLPIWRGSRGRLNDCSDMQRPR